MSDELLDRVRAVDPLPEGSTPPPFESVYARLADKPRQRRRQRRRRLLGLFVPAMSVAVAIGVLVAAVSLLHASPKAGHHRASEAAHRPPHATTSARIPSGGMPGYLTVWGAGFNSGGDGVVSLEQCLRCGKDGNWSSRSIFRDWLLTTRDGGETWTRVERGYYLEGPLLTGQEGWAGGLQMLSRKQGAGPAKWEPGAGIARYYVTHDGGRDWSVAPSAAPNEGNAVTTLVDGEVWAVGLGTRVAILHSPVHASRLTATSAQPIQGDYTNVRVAGGGAATAYVVNGNAPKQSFATHDNGRTWERLTPPPCTGKDAFVGLDAAYGKSIWLTCSGLGLAPVLVRSLDGGHSWEQLRGDWGGRNFPLQIIAVSGQVAWARIVGGEVFRTTNAGATWQPVWSAADARVSPLSRPITKLSPSPLPILSAQSAKSASIVTLLNRGRTGREAKLTDLVVYRTTNGGQSWHAYPMAL